VSGSAGAAGTGRFTAFETGVTASGGTGRLASTGTAGIWLVLIGLMALLLGAALRKASG